MDTPKKKKWQPDVCSGCHQTLNYALPLSRGNALMLLALYITVRRKGINRIHVGDEMVVDKRAYPSYRDMVADGKITFKMEGNMTTLKRHGLAAQADKEGWWLITPKGAEFLRGKEVPKTAIVDKTTGHKSHYLEETTTFSKLLRDETPWWEHGIFEEAQISAYIPEPTLF